jgi:hypothetical protein
LLSLIDVSCVKYWSDLTALSCGASTGYKSFLQFDGDVVGLITGISMSSGFLPAT